MPSIIETIREYDEDILSMIAENWGIDLQLKAGKNTAEQIAALIRQKQIMDEIFDTLPEKTALAIRALVEAKGEIPWDQFTRAFGEMRDMGAARRERERPDRTPISVTETLFYKAIIGRAFFKTDKGLREFAFIPDEFYASLKTDPGQNKTGRLDTVADAQIEKKLLANDHIIDLVSTVLAGLRNGFPAEALEVFTPGIPISFLIMVLRDAGIIASRLELSPELVKTFLETARPSALAQITKAWQFSSQIDELDLIKTLIFEGPKKNKPLSSRTSLITHIDNLPDESWVAMDDFRDWVFRRHPDLLRSGGEYDAWFVKNCTTGEYVRGFENWQHVEGEYIRMMLQKPLFWMGLVDLGKTRGDSIPTVFRKSKWFNALRTCTTLNYPVLLKKDFEIEKSGKIIIDRFFPRDIRYQIARCCDWEGVRGHKFFYRLSPQAFARMEQQGLKISQLVTLINHFAKKPVPENILAVLEHWNRNGREAEIGTTLIIKVKSSQLLDKLMDTPSKKFIINRLNATTAEISPGSAPYIRATLLEIGILAEILPEV